MAELLLTRGANVNVLGCDKETVLHDASINGHADVSGPLSRSRPLLPVFLVLLYMRQLSHVSGTIGTSGGYVAAQTWCKC